MKLRITGVSQDLEVDDLTGDEELVTTLAGECMNAEDKCCGAFYIQVKNQDKLYGYVRPGDTLQII